MGLMVCCSLAAAFIPWLLLPNFEIYYEKDTHILQYWAWTFATPIFFWWFILKYIRWIGGHSPKRLFYWWYLPPYHVLRSWILYTLLRHARPKPARDKSTNKGTAMVPELLSAKCRIYLAGLELKTLKGLGLRV